METKKLLLSLIVILILFQIQCKKDLGISNEKDIISFEIDGVNGIINDDNTISISGFYNWDINKLTPQIKTSSKSIITPKSGVEQDFSDPVIYTVTAEDGSTKEYIVSVSLISNGNNEITQFKLSNDTYSYFGIIDNNENTVTFGIPFNAGRTDSLITEIQISDPASVFPESGNLIGSVYEPNTFIVTAQNGDTRNYTVEILNSLNYITYFKIHELPDYFFSGFSPWQTYWPDDTVGLSGKTFNIGHVLKTDDISNLCPEILISDFATMVPSQDNTCNDFNQDVEYIVTSESGLSRTHIIRLIKHSIMFPNDWYPGSYNGFYEGETIQLWHRSISDIVSADLINEDTNEIIECNVSTNNSTWNIYTAISYFYPINTTIGVGHYRVKVYLQNGEEVLTRCGVHVMQN